MNKNVTVLDMQPIDPPVGGGRIRLLGLYSGLGAGLNATYIGSYDWPGPKKRSLMLSPCLTEIDIPLSPEHFEENDKLNKLIPGKTIIDVTFPLLAHHSPQLINEAHKYAQETDIVVFSHPWLFPSVAPVLKNSSQLIIYDSQNHEGLLRTKLLCDGSEFGYRLAKEVVRTEYELCQVADLVLVCSLEDSRMFTRLYGVDPAKIMLAPNGVFSEKIRPINDYTRNQIKAKLGFNNLVATFIGSNYPPNIEAARIIIEVARSMKNITFLIIGGAGEAVGLTISKSNLPQNVVLTGQVEEKDKLDYLTATDIALNPMMSGSGTNIKMFDYMAAGIPTITTKIGARGIPMISGQEYLVYEPEHLAAGIAKLVDDCDLRTAIGKEGRKLVEEKFSWERISNELGIKLDRYYKYKTKTKAPFFSIIVPTYDRPRLLAGLLDRLNDQTDQDFEVIIIDQSENAWDKLNQYDHLNLLYIHSEIRGAVKARNTGMTFAVGQVVAFIDDDCQPDCNWLKNARRYFLDNLVIGIEGMITSSHIGDPNYRTVSNVGFEGYGFMTANLFIKRGVLNQIGGFDERFDNPHFREDTDLGWRALEYGNIPYARDVLVYHPPHPRKLQRESEEERAKFFVNDPLLYTKHPQRYIELFLAEQHYKQTDGFWEFFLKGVKKHAVHEKFDLFMSDSRVDMKYIPGDIKNKCR